MVGQELSTTSKLLRAFSALDSQKEEVKMPRTLTSDTVSMQHQAQNDSFLPFEQGPPHMTPNHNQFYPNPRPSIGAKESFIESSSDIFHTKDAKEVLNTNKHKHKKKQRYAQSDADLTRDNNPNIESFEHLSADCLNSVDDDETIQPQQQDYMDALPRTSSALQ